MFENDPDFSRIISNVEKRQFENDLNLSRVSQNILYFFMYI